MSHPQRHLHRRGFTLVELLVALALIVFIMSILSQAFVSATKVFRDLKGAGDLAERLRIVSSRLQRELAADHFEGKKRLSSPSFWLNGPPRQGFFNLYQGAASTVDGTDGNGVPSTVSVSDALHFTVKLRGDDLGSFFSTSCPLDSSLFGPVDARYQYGNTVPLYNYPWAEIALFLQPSIDPNTGQQDTAYGTPLYNLFHRQRLAVLDNGLVPQQQSANQGQFLEVSCEPDPTNANVLYFNNPADLTVPQRRFGLATAGSVVMPPGGWQGPAYPTLVSQGATSGALANADLLLTDVVSFEVRALFATPNGATATPTQTPMPGSTVIPSGNPAQPYMTLWDAPMVNMFPTTNSVIANANVRVFDTWSQANDLALGAGGNYTLWSVVNPPAATSIPLWNQQMNTGPLILALQITIRIWDPRTEQTRQVTIVQAM